MAALQIAGAVIVYFVARSAMHQILAATMFGMGVIAFALGVLIENGNKQRELLERLSSHLPHGCKLPSNS